MTDPSTSLPAPHDSAPPLDPAAVTGPDYEPLATDLLPVTSATITVRIIKSFEFRTERNMVLKTVDLVQETVGGLMERCKRGESGFGLQRLNTSYGLA